MGIKRAKKGHALFDGMAKAHKNHVLLGIKGAKGLKRG
jgi:hypothetical protein